MLSPADLERLIAVKRREIQNEKTALGLAPPPLQENLEQNDDEKEELKKVTFSSKSVPKFRDERPVAEEEQTEKRSGEDRIDYVPPDLERYIRRYLGLPVMLKAGEYSPNNPLVRGEPPRERDAFIGLGDYEERCKTLRKLRQREYKEYLDQQAKKKQEQRAQAEKERLEKEQKELERERQLQERERLQRERDSARELERDRYINRDSVCNAVGKVDSGVQVNSGGWKRPLSVAVQTDESELLNLPPSPSKLTQAERELSPRTVVEACNPSDERPIQPAAWAKGPAYEGRRRSYGDFDERTTVLKKTNRDKMATDLRHTYMPSIFDAEAIHLRNVQAEKEAAEKRQYYQQELRNQIMEQQRIREERKAREKMLEQAEMRRLEEQLRMLRLAQDKEHDRQRHMTATIRESKLEYDKQRENLQKEIDDEQKNLLRATSQPSKYIKRPIYTSKSETNNPKVKNDDNTVIETRKPYSMNIPDNSIFSANYDVDRYLRQNLNPSRESLMLNRLDSRSDYTEQKKSPKNSVSPESPTKSRRFSFAPDYENNSNKIVETALIHEAPRNLAERPIARLIPKSETMASLAEAQFKRAENDYDFKKLAGTQIGSQTVAESQNGSKKVAETNGSKKVAESASYEPSFLKKSVRDEEAIPIPVLRHSPKVHLNSDSEVKSDVVSDAMKRLEDKWKVPAVQKNIVRSLPSGDGLLTQLGSIRRQLQAEQLKLDLMLAKDTMP